MVHRVAKLPVLFLVCLLLAACATVPISGRRQLSMIPSGTILSMSHQQYGQFLEKHELSDDKAAVKMVKDVGRNIADSVEAYMEQNGLKHRLQNYDWEFKLVKDDTVNAWCMPGGKVVIYTGILPVTKDRTGLAVVMGHEIAHAIAKHGNERMSQGLLIQFGGIALSEALQTQPAATRQLWMAAYGLGGQIGVMLPYSRLQEKEADRLGLVLMAMAGYDPRAAVDFWQRMAEKKEGKNPPEFLSTHPPDQERIRNIKAMMPEAMGYYKK